MSSAGRLAALESTAIDLVTAALTPATAKSYNSTLLQSQSFFNNIDSRYRGLPANSGQILLFIAHLYQSGLTSSTIHTKMSAISYYHKLLSLPDPMSSFVVQKALVGVKKLASSSDSRLPITLQLLQQLIDNVRFIVSDHYYRKMLQSMMCLAFFAFLRPGELTSSPNNLVFENIKLSNNQISITFVAFKHHRGKPVTLIVPAQDCAPCPVSYLTAYLSARGDQPGPLFCHPSMKPVTYAQFHGWFHTLLDCLSVKHVYNLHSFRLGAASLAASRKISNVLIQQMGRWRSNAYERYVRIPVIKF